MATYRYELDKRPEDLGGGYRLRLFEDDQEVGGGVFPPDDDTEAAELDAHMAADDEGRYWLSTRPSADGQMGMAWWNHITESERAHWLAVAGSAVPADAWAAFKRNNPES